MSELPIHASIAAGVTGSAWLCRRVLGDIFLTMLPPSAAFNDEFMFLATGCYLGS